MRLSGRISFDRARHPSDAGLFGAIGMLPWFRSHRRGKNRRHRYRPAHSTQPGQESFNSSSYRSSNPLTTPYMAGASAANHGSQSVQSYLRPEQAATPYREDGDDPDRGYILGAFHDETLEAPMRTQPPPPPPSSNTGFTRIAGGRATFETPFAIRNPPDADQRRHQQGSGSAASPATTSYPPNSYSLPNPPSSSTVPQAEASSNSLVSSGKRNHWRRKSETAVIEDASALHIQNPRFPNRDSRGPPTPTNQAMRDPSQGNTPIVEFGIDDDDSDTNVSVTPRRKYWFGSSKNQSSDHRRADSDDGGRSRHGDGSLGIWPFRRGRNKSEADAFTAATPEPEPTPGPSFQVVRRPQQRPSRPIPSAYKRPSTAPDQEEDVATAASRRQSSPFGY